MTAILLTACVVAMALMVDAGVLRRRLAWRTHRCSVCHRPLGSCSCRWL